MLYISSLPLHPDNIACTGAYVCHTPNIEMITEQPEIKNFDQEHNTPPGLGIQLMI